MTRSVLDLPPTSEPGRALVAGAATCALHAGIVVIAVFSGAHSLTVAQPVKVSELIELEPPPPPEPPPQVETKTSPPERKLAAPAPGRAQSTPASEAPPPVPARAGEVLTATDDVVDFGEAFVSGRGTSYAGGATQTNGTADRAVRDASTRPGAADAGTGTLVGSDRSQPPRLAGGSTWSCPFPAEADELGLHHATVALEVAVGPRGEVLRVSVTSDPGDGFGREALRCAKSKRWSPGLDRNGTPTTSTAIVRVRFER